MLTFETMISMDGAMLVSGERMTGSGTAGAGQSGAFVSQLHGVLADSPQGELMPSATVASLAVTGTPPASGVQGALDWLAASQIAVPTMFDGPMIAPLKAGDDFGDVPVTLPALGESLLSTEDDSATLLSASLEDSHAVTDAGENGALPVDVGVPAAVSITALAMPTLPPADGAAVASVTPKGGASDGLDAPSFFPPSLAQAGPGGRTDGSGVLTPGGQVAGPGALPGTPAGTGVPSAPPSGSDQPILSAGGDGVAGGQTSPAANRAGTVGLATTNASAEPAGTAGASAGTAGTAVATDGEPALRAAGRGGHEQLFAANPQRPASSPSSASEPRQTAGPATSGLLDDSVVSVKAVAERPVAAAAGDPNGTAPARTQLSATGTVSSTTAEPAAAPDLSGGAGDAVKAAAAPKAVRAPVEAQDPGPAKGATAETDGDTTVPPPLARPATTPVGEGKPEALPAADGRTGRPAALAGATDTVVEADAEAPADDVTDMPAQKRAAPAAAPAARPVAGPAAAPGMNAAEAAVADKSEPQAVGERLEISAAGTRAEAAVARPAASATAATLPTAMMAMEIARNAQRGVSRFEIRLDPPELGRVDVHLKIGEDGKVQAHLIVERRDTLDMFMRDQRGMERALENAGLKSSSDGGLQFSLKDQGQRSAGQNGQPGHGNGTSGRPDSPAGETAEQPAVNRIAAYARNGARGLDIQV